MISDPRCQILPIALVDEGAKVMGDAFANTPAFNYIFQGDIKYRRKALKWMFKQNLTLVTKQCPSAFRGILDDEGNIAACFLWTLSSQAHISTSSKYSMLKAGMWQIPFRFGLATLLRLFEVMDDLHAAEDFFQTGGSNAPQEFIRLKRVAVSPNYQRMGLGSKMLKSAIAETKCPMFLSTHEYSSVKFYERLGYRVVGEIELSQDCKEHTFSGWFMTQEPATTGASIV